MHFFTDEMAGPMQEEVAVPGVLNHGAADMIDFPSKGKLARRYPFPDEGQCRIAPSTDLVENHALYGGHPHSGVPRPGNVAIHGAGRGPFCPEIDQNKILASIFGVELDLAGP